MKTKTIRLPEEILRGIAYRAEKEDIEESTAIRKLLREGLMEYATKLYKEGEITLEEAAQLAGISLRRMLETLLNKGIRGNVTLSQQKKTLEHVKKIK
jgi:predicted HTH domain antitoxin